MGLPVRERLSSEEISKELSLELCKKSTRNRQSKHYYFKVSLLNDMTPNDKISVNDKI